MSSFFSQKWKQVQNWIKATFLTFSKTPKIQKGIEKQCRCRILCVDDDPSFCQYISRLGYEIDIHIDEAYTVQEAKQMIESTDYQAFIIDGHLPDGSGFEIVAWIREKKEFNAPIGFISRIYQDSKSFRVLKEGLQVDYVLEKPLSPTEVHQLLTKLCHLIVEAHIHEPFSEDVLADLRANYNKTISDKVERLEKMILDIQKDPIYENLQTLKSEVHKIAGSAGSYGFPTVSELCKNLELDLIKQMELAKENRFSSQWTTTLDEFFTQVKLRFQMDFQDKDVLVKPSYFTTIYVVDEDQESLNLFTKPYQDTHFDVLTEDHPEKAIQKLSSLDIFPQIMLLNDRYQSTNLRGYDLIQAFYKKNDYLCTTSGLMMNQKEQQDAVEALQKGMTFILIKPFSIPLILSLLDQAPFRALPLHHKVLVIDDDLDICQYIVKNLKFVNLDVDYLQNSIDLKKNLAKFQPDLILLDMNLVDEAGEEVLKKLRSDLQFGKTIVGMLAFSKDISLIQKCYHSDVDELLFKPLEGGVLQRKVAFLLKRQEDEFLKVQYEEVTGLKNKQTLTRYLDAVNQQENDSLPKTLMLFEVEGLDLLSHSHKKKLLIKISKKIENDLLHKYEMASYLEEGFFGLVFQGHHSNFVDLFMRTFLVRLNEEIQSDNKINTIHLNGSLLVFSKETSKNAILQKSYELLDLARQERGDQVIGWKNSQAENKDLLIFQEDTHAMEAIKKLLESHGMKLTYLNTFEELFSQSISTKPALILIDTADGKKDLNLLKKLFLEQIQIPILHLSQWPEEFLIKLLNEINYFERPFPLVLLEGKSL